MLTITTRVFGNNGRLLPQSPSPLRHPKKNHPGTLCQLSSKLSQEPLSFPTQKYHEHRWLSWSPVTVRLQASFQSCAPRLPLTGPHRPLLAGWQVTVDMPPTVGVGTNGLFAFQHALFQKSPPESHVRQKPVGVSSLPTSEGQCWPYVPLLLFWLPCLARGSNFQSHMCSSTPLPISGVCVLCYTTLTHAMIL